MLVVLSWGVLGLIAGLVAGLVGWTSVGRGVALELGEVAVEAVEAAVPEDAIALDPVGDVLEGLGGEAAGAPLGVAAALDEVGALEDLEVLGDGGEGHGEGCCELGDGCFALDEAGEDGAPGGVGEGGEGGAEGVAVGCGGRHVVYRSVY
jgi:hypothetical protein